MARNLSEIGDTIQNINWTFQEIDINNILPNAIQTTNESSGGWVGLTIFIILCISAYLHILKNKNPFNIFDKFNLIFVALNVFLDVGIYLLLFGILESLQIYVFLFVIFFIMAVFSLLRKEMLNSET